MEIQLISRQESLKTGLNKYFTGIQCPKGHVSQRYTNNFECVKCSIESRKNYEREKFPYVRIVQTAIFRAKQKNLPFDISVAWAKETWTGRCALTGLEFNWNKGKKHAGAYSPSLDRIIPNLGYVKTNCRWILYAINCFKHDGTDDDMYEIAELLLKNRR